MSGKAIIYDQSGKIVRIVSADDTMLAMQAGTGEFVLFGEASQDAQYIDQGSVIDRPVMAIATDKANIIANGVDAVTFANVPVGAHVVIQRIDDTAILDAINNGTPIPRTEGTIATGSDTFVTSIAGTYQAVFSLWPYLDKEIIINAT